MAFNNFTRPSLPYANQSLPNDNRFVILTRNLQAPPTDITLDSEFNALTDNLRTLDTQMQSIVAGNIPGSSVGANANKFVITDGAGNLSWSFVLDSNCTLGSISGNKLIDSTVTALQILDGSITNSKLAFASVDTSNIIDLNVTTSKIALGAITAAQIADDTITNQQIEGLTITAALIANNTIIASKIANQTITATQIANNTITATQIANNTITIAQLATQVLNMFIPIGTVIEFAGTTGVPANFIECVGGTVLIATYPTYFANVGTRWGGDGITTVGIPDRRGRVAVGISSTNSTNGLITAATAPAIVLGSTGVFGTETIILDITQIPAHTHTLPLNGGGGGSNYFQQSSNGTIVNTPTGSSGGGLAHMNTQPSIFSRFYIRAL